MFARRGEEPPGPDSASSRWQAFDPLGFPGAEMRLLAGICALIAVASTLWHGGLDADWLSWWVGTSAALVVALAYLDRYSGWYPERFGHRGWLENLIATIAPLLVLLAPRLDERPSSALIGALLCVPFLVVAERWRRQHARLARTT
jgi:hypothetical protein